MIPLSSRLLRNFFVQSINNGLPCAFVEPVLFRTHNNLQRSLNVSELGKTWDKPQLVRPSPILENSQSSSWELSYCHHNSITYGWMLLASQIPLSPDSFTQGHVKLPEPLPCPRYYCIHSVDGDTFNFHNPMTTGHSHIKYHKSFRPEAQRFKHLQVWQCYPRTVSRFQPEE